MAQKFNIFNRYKKQPLWLRILILLAALIAITVLPLLIIAGVACLFSHNGFIQVMKQGWLYAVWGAYLLIVAGLALFEFRVLGSRRVKKVNRNLEDSHFMTKKEIAQNSGFTTTTLTGLSNCKDGLLMLAERKGKDLEIVLHNPIHELIIATTGTGKTAAYVSPFIEVLARTKTKPCMVITDPKGELYCRHATSLKKLGYNVHIVDMLDTYHSSLWNPFNDIWRKTDEMSGNIRQEKGRYLFDGKRYDTMKEAEQAKRETVVRLRGEIYVDLQDLIYTMCPVEAAQDKSWQQGARDLLFGLALRFWEDVRDGLMPREKFNLYNLWWNLTEYAKPENGECGILKGYIGDIADERSRAEGVANTVLVSQDRTLTSYLGSVNQYLHWLADDGIAQLTSGNEIEFMDWDEAPNVLFVRVPDAKDNRHGAVTLLLGQMYKALLEKADKNVALGKTKDQQLLRNCYFLMDEFGNLPKIHKFEKIITIARSRKIFMMPVIQDFGQLENVYGKVQGEIIRNNCNVKIFMGTNDDKTRNEISEACGKHKVKQVSYNEEKGMSVSTSAQSVPLVYPSELIKLNDPDGGVIGNSIVLSSGNFPIMGKTTPYFKAMDLYGIEQSNIPLKDFMEFDELANRYDIKTVLNLKKPPLTAEEAEQTIRAAAMDQAVCEIAEPIISRIKDDVAKKLQKLADKLDDGDKLRLALSTTAQKIKVLDELADKAVDENNIILAGEIDGLRELLVCNYDELIIGETENEKEGDYL